MIFKHAPVIISDGWGKEERMQSLKDEEQKWLRPINSQDGREMVMSRSYSIVRGHRRVLHQ